MLCASSVPITASGLQGEKPLADSEMQAKGSRQIKRVPSVKVLAPRAEHAESQPMRGVPLVPVWWVRPSRLQTRVKRPLCGLKYLHAWTVGLELLLARETQLFN